MDILNLIRSCEKDDLEGVLKYQQHRGLMPADILLAIEISYKKDSKTVFRYFEDNHEIYIKHCAYRGVFHERFI